MDLYQRDIANNNFGDNTRIHQGDIYNSSPSQADQCLADLRPTDPRDDKIRIQQTKGGLLEASYRWIFENEDFKKWRDNEESRLLWIKGDPGKGKTMLLCGIIDKVMPTTKLARPTYRTNRLLSYFFCQGTDSRINTATAVLRGLIYLIVIQQPSLISHVQEKYKNAGKDLFTDINAWAALSEMLSNILRDLKTESVILIIDALDECEVGLSNLLDFITRHSSMSQVKWIISSRNVINIQQKLAFHTPQGILSLELKENAESVSRAVDAYIKHSISRLYAIQDNQDLQVKLRQMMQEKAHGTFLWVSLVMRELEEVEIWEVMQVVMEMPTDLKAVYERMMSQIQRLKRGNAELCRDILSIVFVAYRPLSLAEVGILSTLPQDTSESLASMKRLVAMCGSFLTIREGSIYFVHQSAKDFLSTDAFRDNIKEIHMKIYERSIAVISKLHKNIYSLPHFGFRQKDAQPPNPNPLAPRRYSCVFWADHLCDGLRMSPKSNIEVIYNETLWSFLKNHLLLWLESMSLLGGLPESIRSISRVLQELDFSANQELLEYLGDIERFIVNNGSIIGQAPLQVYGSALIFSPQLSQVKKHQWAERLSFVEGVWGTRDYDSCLQTLEGHTDAVKAIAFSPDGLMLASGSDDKSVLLWDATTGVYQRRLDGHSGWVNTIAFFPDCKILASGSQDNTIRLWNLETGTHHCTLGGHRRGVMAIAISPNGDVLASGSRDGTMRLWDIKTGAYRTLEGHGNRVLALAFSPDGKMLVSGSKDRTIQLWDVIKGVRQYTIKGHIDRVRAIVFSPDGKTLVSGSDDKSIKLWDVATGSRQHGIMAHHDGVRALVVSPDGKTLASGSNDESIRLWDMTTGEHQHTLHGHSRVITALSFSPNGKILASGSGDETIRLWNSATNAHSSRKNYVDLVKSINSAPDGKILALVSYKSIQLYDATTGAQWQTYKFSGGLDIVATVKFSPDSRMLALVFHNESIQLWDATTGAKWYTLRMENYSAKFKMRGFFHRASIIEFSPDGKTLAFFSARSICLSDVTTSAYSYVHGNWDGAIAFSPNGETLASGLDDVTIALWNLATSARQHTLIGHSKRVNAIAFSPNGKIVASGSEDTTIRLWDSATGAHQHTLLDHSSMTKAIAFSPNGKIIASVSPYSPIRLWDSVTGAPYITLDTHGESITTIAFSGDGQFLKTSHGYRRISPPIDDACALQKPPDRALLVDGEWITIDGMQVLWLPPDYRTGDVAVHGNAVALGHTLGVTWLYFNLRSSLKFSM